MLIISSKLNVKEKYSVIRRETKNKMIYYKKVINPELKDQNHTFNVSSVKKENKYCKIRINSHELYDKSGKWKNPKTL